MIVINNFLYHLLASHFLKLAGQEGLEPPTLGFGDRRSTIGATDLSNLWVKPKRLTLKLNFFMKRMLV